MAPRDAERHRLVKEVWPDKRLYACTMLVVAGLAGMLFEIAKWVFGVTLAISWDPGRALSVGSLPFLLSLAVVLAALAAWRLRKNAWVFLAVALGALSLGMIGIETLLSIVALGFLVMSAREREDASPPLHRRLWPDKSLAASLLGLVGALVALAWCAALLGGSVDLGAATLPLGALAALAFALDAAAAWLLYYQRAPWIGVAGAIAGAAAASFFLIGPLLSIGELVLIGLAWREREFTPQPPLAEPASGATP